MSIYPFLALVLSYLLGSIPTAVWVGKKYYGLDVREHGSKNAGATNTFRVLGKKPGIIVLLIDIVKGVIAVLIMQLLPHEFSEDIWSYFLIGAAILAVMGHMFPVFAQFKGGKGVATSLGVILGLYPAAAAICVIVFLIVFLISHYVSLGAIMASLIFPILVLFVFKESMELKVFSLVLSFLVIYKHKLNIRRLLEGTESKMKVFKK